jgi:uncharacterized repeat protein (TIGR01451 family)
MKGQSVARQVWRIAPLLPLVAALVLPCASPLHAQTPYLVKDINPDLQFPPDSSDPAPLAALGNVLFFAACEPDHGCEPWISDGTPAGTSVLKDISVLGSSAPSHAVSLNGTTFFLATDDSSMGAQVWQTDGTPGGTIRALPQGDASDLAAANGRLYFNTFGPNDPAGLWASDGTPAGTQLVLAHLSGQQVTAAGGTTFFTFYEQLWKTDGTPAGTVLIEAFRPGFGVHDLTAAGARVFFGVDDDVHGDELWTSDGTPAGTVMVKDINPSDGSKPHSFAALGGELIFTANDGQHGSELWRSDGTTAGTFMLADIVPGSDESDPVVLGVLGGRVLFSADDGTLHRSLWITDGTSAGTSFVAAIDVDYFQPNLRATLNGSLYFEAPGQVYSALWKSDGTAAGTQLVKDVEPATNGMLAVGAAIYFEGFDNAHGNELWKTDGTESGTVLVKDINTDGAPSEITELTNVNGRAFFTAREPTDGLALWKSDGTPGGTGILKDIDPTSTFGQIDSLTDVSGTLFFSAFDDVHGKELWKSDGTSAGTVLVKDIEPGNGSSDPAYLANLDGTLFFDAGDDPHGFELWKSDGTDAGTVLVRDINPGTASSIPTQPAAANGLLFFTADDGQTGREVWRSDGTSAGTFLLKDILPGDLDSVPSDLTPAGDKLFFLEHEFGQLGIQLWVTDGTTAGTVMLLGSADIQIDGLKDLGGTLLFRLSAAAQGAALWKSDGTVSGTLLVKMFATGFGFDLTTAAAVGSRVFFPGGDSDTGMELWTSDGTAALTRLVKDIAAGTASSSPSDLVDWNGTLYFAANDAITGRELWKSDGTAAGTVRVGDIRPGLAGSAPEDLTPMGSLLLFTADDGKVGRELWAVSNLADLAVSKTDGQASAVPGKTVSYTLVAANAGPNAVSGAIVDDTLPAALLNAHWTCAASPGAVCTPAGSGSIHDSVSLPVTGSVTYSLSATVNPAATGTLANTATVTPPAGMVDPVGANDSATDTDSLTPQADLQITKTDGQSQATPGAAVTYTITASNVGPSDAPGSGVSDAFPGTITGISWACTASGAAACGAPSGSGNVSDTASLPVGDSVTYVASGTLDAGATGTLVNTANVSAGTGVTELDASNNSSTDVDNLTLSSLSELVHGTSSVRSLQAQPGPVETKDYFWVNQPPQSSFEVAIDGVTGSISSGSGPSLDLLAGDASTVVASSVVAGAGSSRSLRFENAGSAARSDELVRVQSNGCTTDCGPDAQYRVRTWETTYHLPRFNNSGTQVTILLLKNDTATTEITGHIWFWNASGQALASQAFDLTAQELLILNSSTLAPAASGTVTVSHDGPYGGLSGKAVALEPATGFTFDTPLEPRGR